MIVQNVTSMEELFSIVNRFPNPYIYRGHSNSSWSLRSTLERGCGNNFNKEFAGNYEKHACEEFSSRFHLYDKENVSPKSLLEWLALMQHYGVPTRLLDFTSSPYAALYFALEDYDKINRPDMALYCLNYTELMEKSLELIKAEDNHFSETRATINGRKDEIFEECVERFNRNILWVTEPQRLNARIDRQAGCFVLSGDKGKSIQAVIDEEAYSEVGIRKLVISGVLFENIFALLRKMNISGKSIYGDLVGLSRSLSLELKVYAD
ncbi:FRG domain-containing protein [Halomonas sp. BC04]|uniref:FRG domain-containing protein n=1 Tax=Halomonas sp. BC04 TaxID=1403540 RepID=UPI0004B1A798|nr:FRG domain-containing protein [Halomonas sp. BC04]